MIYNDSKIEFLDLSTDPVIEAYDAEIEMANYAMESAQFEVECGKEEFGVVVEAALNKTSKSKESWFVTVKNKVSAFIRKIISAISSALAAAKAAISGKKAKEAAEKAKKDAVKKGVAIGAAAVAVSAGALAYFHFRKKKPYKKELEEELNEAKKNLATSGDDLKALPRGKNELVPTERSSNDSDLKALPRGKNELVPTERSSTGSDSKDIEPDNSIRVNPDDIQSNKNKMTLRDGATKSIGETGTIYVDFRELKNESDLIVKESNEFNQTIIAYPDLVRTVFGSVLTPEQDRISRKILMDFINRNSRLISERSSACTSIAKKF